MDLIDDLKDYHEKLSEVKNEEHTLEEYLELVEKNPHLADGAHKHQNRMIQSAGTRYDEEKEVKRYNFFEDDLYGIAETIEEIMTNYYEPAAAGLDVRRRMLLLMGPPGSGKSTLVNKLKRGLEQYTLTDDGARYMLKGCPQQDDPLLVIPDEMRPKFEEKFNTTIEGDPCPYCQWRLDEKFDGDIMQFTVKRLVFNENNRRGIGTFVPSDPKNQDISELVGSVDLSELADKPESHPDAYRFDGSLNAANRGIMEFIELFKADRSFLNKLITLCEERVIKPPRFPLMYADEVVIGHTNETEYDRFMNDPENEALRRRIKVVRCPYNLKLDQEVRIYEKLLDESTIEDDVHVAPHTLKAAAHYALMTRFGLEEPELLKSVIKAENGDNIGDLSDEDINERLDKLPDNVGMFGLSPTEMIDAISSAAMTLDTDYLFFTDILSELKDKAKEHEEEVPGVEAGALKEFVIETRDVIDDDIAKDVKEAFVLGFEDSARELFHKYLDYVEAYCEDEPIEDPVTGAEMSEEQAEQFMRSIEEQIGVGDKAKDGFRKEMRGKIGGLAIQDDENNFDWTAVPRLKEAIEEKLFNQVKDFIRISTDTTRKDMEAKRRLNAAIEELEGKGYSAGAAQKAVEYVGKILSR